MTETAENTEIISNWYEGVVWLIVTLTNQAMRMFNLRNQGGEKPLLTADEVELLTTPTDLTTFKDAITQCLFKGTKRNVESEESKNAVDG